MRLTFLPAEAAQVDFGSDATIADVHIGQMMKSWIFVMRLTFSRRHYARLVRDQTVATWLTCHRRAFEHVVVPERTFDHLNSAITRASINAGWEVPPGRDSGRQPVAAHRDWSTITRS
ncbi:hypothetical protein [Tahibacter sp.]|uniref:hypothetical protein n=1 Tax=Tahibacter sp. TaxID=2056211 RepID=UPI0028C50066|nr:hypothetical protein [Tahibacter sp.]